MNIVTAQQPFELSIFLAGPTPRSPDVRSWRPEAIQLLAEFGFTGRVFVPEDVSQIDFIHARQVRWEWAALNSATVILFWVPRELTQMPAFTTNIEFGLYVSTRKCVLGFPQDSEKMAYLAQLAYSYGVPTYQSLRETVRRSIELCDEFSIDKCCT